jgi:MFS family permease
MITLPADRAAIYSCALFQGAVTVIFAAYTAVFIAEYHYDLSLSHYGALFIPQVFAAVVATFFSATIGNRLYAKRAYRAGLGCSLLGLALLIATEWAERLASSYPLLLTATAFVGAGFGLTLPFLRSYAVSFKPLRARRQILLVNGLVAVGMATAPLYVLATRATAIWWSLPLLLGVVVAVQMLLSRSLRALPDGAPSPRADREVPARFHAYPVLALLYGVCAIICITGPHFLTGGVLEPRLSSVVLAEVGFWAALVAGGRIVFAIIDGMKSRRLAASIGVFMIALVLAILSATVSRYDLVHFGIYLLAAIGCAALLPIDTRPGHEHIAQFPIAVTVGLLALFPVGLGLSRFGVDIVARSGVSSFGVYLGVAIVGAVACMLLLPIILNWRTMAYFERPSARTVALPGTGYSATATPGPQAGPEPRRLREGSQDDRGGSEPGGATAVPRQDERRGAGERSQ